MDCGLALGWAGCGGRAAGLTLQLAQKRGNLSGLVAEAGKERKPHPGPSEKAGQGAVGAGRGPACLKVKSLPGAGGTQFIPPVGSSIRGSPTLPPRSDLLPHCALGWIHPRLCLLSRTWCVCMLSHSVTPDSL